MALALNRDASLSVYPTREELHGEQQRARKNVVNGRYSSLEEYISVNLQLLREDFVRPFCKAVNEYFTQNIKSSHIDVYHDASVDMFVEGNKRVNVLFLNPNTNIANMEDSKIFLDGSLLLLTRNGSLREYYLAKVVTRYRADFTNNAIFIEFVDNEVIGDSLTVVESLTFFEPYYQVYNSLLDIDEDFPMQRYLVDVDPTEKRKPFGDIIVPTDEDMRGLNPSQARALKAALCEEFVVIQGPPGTGKTHLGLRIVEVLLKNKRVWDQYGNILVISNKNQSLDQFLEGASTLTNEIIRVGGQSRDINLARFNLSNYQDEFGALESCSIAGMTTTCAARYRGVLNLIRFSILIVEEAAEVLEPHVMAAISRHCKLVIMLGDHKQLRPPTADYFVGNHLKLGVSMFERMVNNGVQCYRLDVQRRMRPEISRIIRDTTYPFLQDDEVVRNRPDVKGLAKNVFFLDYTKEETSVGTSKKNEYEASFVVYLARYLVQNGHAPRSITILTTYRAQEREIKNKMNALNEFLIRNVNVTTLDSFQGQESEIVILSLVRTIHPGFIANDNRACVVLSRAKSGLYIVGKMDLFAESSKMWHTIRESLRATGSIGNRLPLRCENHGQITRVRNISDFANVRFGGCNRRTGGHFLRCSHFCGASHCHPLRNGQCGVICQSPCRRSVCDFHNFLLCTRLCCERCDQCRLCALRGDQDPFPLWAFLGFACPLAVAA